MTVGSSRLHLPLAGRLSSALDADPEPEENYTHKFGHRATGRFAALSWRIRV